MQASDRIADVLIIGGGITGCSTAYNLTKAGSRVILLKEDHKGELAALWSLTKKTDD